MGTWAHLFISKSHLELKLRDGCRVLHRLVRGGFLRLKLYDNSTSAFGYMSWALDTTSMSYEDA